MGELAELDVAQLREDVVIEEASVELPGEGTEIGPVSHPVRRPFLELRLGLTCRAG